MSNIYNYNTNTVISGTAGDDYIYNDDAKYNVTIEAGAGNDAILNHGGEVKIFAGEGNDSIYTDIFGMEFQHATVYGEGGDDTIKIRDHRSLLDGGAGSDVISVYSSAWKNNTLRGGKGNDIIYGGSENVFVYSEGDGEDIFYNVAAGDTISIATNNAYSTVASGYDVIVKVGSGSMTLKSAAGKSINFLTAPQETEEISNIEDSIRKMTADEFADLTQKISHVINKLGNSVTGRLLDKALVYLKDMRAALSNQDVGLSGKAKLAKLSGSSLGLFSGLYETINKFAPGKNPLLWGEAAKTNINVLNLLSSLLTLNASYMSAQATLESDTMLNAVIDYAEATEKLDEVFNGIYKVFVKNPKKYGPWSTMNIYVAMLEGGLEIFEQSMKSTQKYYADGKWTLDDTANFLMEVSLAGLYGMSHTLSAGLDDLIYGWIDKATGGDGFDNMSAIEKAAAGYGILAKNIGNAIAKFGSNVVKGLTNMWNQLKGLGSVLGENIGNAVANLLNPERNYDENATYFTNSGEITTSVSKAVASLKITDDKYTYTVLKKTSQNLIIGSANDALGWSINANSGGDIIEIASSKNSTVNGGGGNDSIRGGSGKDKIFGDAGKDTISGGAGNDTLTGGAGNDVFVYESGKDWITDYTAGQDKIKISSGTITKTTYSGNNVVFTIGSGTLTVKDGKGKKITIIDKNNNETTQIYPSVTLPTGIKINGQVLTVLTQYTDSKINLANYSENITDINASSMVKKIKIYGNAKANALTGGKSADTLYGGAGNDILTGGAGNDVFVYSSGKDTITDYTAGDKIKISSGKITKTTYSGKDVIFKIGTGSITVKNGNGKQISIVDAQNKTTTQLYTNMVSSADLFEDDNFISGTARLEDISEITADNYSVAEIKNYELSAQNDAVSNALTYSDKK